MDKLDKNSMFVLPGETKDQGADAFWIKNTDDFDAMRLDFAANHGANLKDNKEEVLVSYLAWQEHKTVREMLKEALEDEKRNIEIRENSESKQID